MLPNLTTAQAGTYTVTVLDANGCDKTTSTNLIVYPTYQSVVNAEICEGDSYTLPDGSLTSAGGTYPITLSTVQAQCDSLITVNVSVIPIEHHQSSVAICQGENYVLPNGTIVTQSGQYISIIASPSTGCNRIDTVAVQIHPSYAVSESVSICEGETYTLPNGQVVSQAGQYAMPYNTLLNGCDSIVTIVLNVNPAPSISFSWLPNEVDVSNTQVQFINDSQNATQWLWNFGGLAVSNERAPAFQFPELMAYNYPICLQAQSQHGCIAEECADLSIKENLIFFCPNAFTPNNDDRNERFIPIVSGHDPAFYKFQVYDRWGQKVFETYNHQGGWLGDHTGGDYHVQNDVYYYRVEVKERLSTETKVFQGHVTVLR